MARIQFPNHDHQAREAHRQWLGMIRPVGLTVSVPALLKAQALLDANTVELRRRYLELAPQADPALLPSWQTLLTEFLDWPADRLVTPPPHELSARLEFCSETLRPTAAARLRNEADSPWLLLIQELPAGTDLDKDIPEAPHQWTTSPQARFERLLKQTGVPIGLLYNQHELRLVYSPAGETPGHLAFKAGEIASSDGRALLAALHLLLHQGRLFSAGKTDSLPAILRESRLAQNDVSNQLAGQVLEALYILLAGFEQANHNPASRDFLKATLDKDPQHVYSGLLNVLLRLVFLLYAEDKGLLPAHPAFQNYYAVNALFEQLRADHARYRDTMSQRFGAWARLLSLFRLLYSGTDYKDFDLPARDGYLFDPQRYPFLEGRNDKEDPLPEHLPAVPDATILQLLEKLLVLDGERLSYRSLDVEQIGSVYEVIMGFELHIAKGRSLALKPAKKRGAPVTINLDALLAVEAKERGKWLKAESGKSLAKGAAKKLAEAGTIEELTAALEKSLARNITPAPVPAGAMIFQPSLARRRSGSHYTPRTLTEPIVRHALAPVLKQLSEQPTPEQILGLKVCDPAMGSGAFLVEACRQLGAALEQAWQNHQTRVSVPPDEDIVLYAQRLVAQRCLYGVDKNPMATDLAKLSLWLATLAKDHPFTFLDHNLRSGDSLVGVSVAQIGRFNWTIEKQENAFGKHFENRINHALKTRLEIIEADEFSQYEAKAQKLKRALDLLGDARLAGDALVAALFAKDKPAERERERVRLLKYVGDLFNTKVVDPASADLLKAAVQNEVRPFHWDLEFPEVFAREVRANPGFDCIVGNPPFAGKNTLIEGNPINFLSWLQLTHPESHGNADLGAHFFRRAFNVLRHQGSMGLIATKTIAQGDTRFSGLRNICTHGGEIYRATKRIVWPGDASAVISVIHIYKGAWLGLRELDGRIVDQITAYLFHEGNNENPAVLEANANKSFQGAIILGMGFTFDDTDKKQIASKLDVRQDLIDKNPANAERIFPYIGGEEINDDPTHNYHRYVIDFDSFPLRRAEYGEFADGRVVAASDYAEKVASDWPDLLDIVRLRVKPSRDTDNRPNYKTFWWRFGEARPGLTAETSKHVYILGLNCGATPHLSIARLPARYVFANTVAVFPFDNFHPFAILQSRVHEVWARFMASSMKDDLRYTPSDCFGTFPFPRNTDLEAIGREYYEFRARLMVDHNQGLTKTYNRFHNPCDHTPAIEELRRLHSAMDRAVLDAYGWQDIPNDCVPQLEFSEEEDDEEEEDLLAEGEYDCRKKYRLRWPDAIRDKVLARLLRLNGERAAEEAAAKAAEPLPPPKPKSSKKPRKTAPQQMKLENL